MEKHAESSSSSSGSSSSSSSSNGSSAEAEGMDAGSQAPKLAALGLVLGIALIGGGGYLFKDQIRGFIDYFIEVVDTWGPLGWAPCSHLECMHVSMLHRLDPGILRQPLPQGG